VHDADVRIRLARAEDLPELQRIEREAGTRFRGLGLLDHLLDRTLSLSELAHHQRAERVWVADGRDGRPLGFAVANVLDGLAHLEELDVVPDAGGRGIGTGLVTTVCDWAAAQGFPAITLSTFRRVPWNAPFYARLGFRTLGATEFPRALRGVRAREEQLGIPMAERVIMRRELAPVAGAPPLHLVLYDGECGVCSRFVRWLLAADRRGVLRYAPVQGPTAAALRERWPALPRDLDSIIYVDRSSGEERVSWRSEALVHLGRLLGGRWRALLLLSWLPRSLADTAYAAFARRRHAFGAPDPTCPLPSAAERARFLP
jgi:predicted DCC family thiol-disulfide oxidoreductase YuxK/GNAT superfamily N-acetyltransferase